MLLHIAALFLASQSPADRMINACVADGNPRPECACYADFIKQHATEREMEALAVLSDPKNRQSAQTAMASLLAAGLTPQDLLEIGIKAQKLQGEAEGKCAQFHPKKVQPKKDKPAKDEPAEKAVRP